MATKNDTTIHVTKEANRMAAILSAERETPIRVLMGQLIAEEYLRFLQKEAEKVVNKE